MSSAIVIGIDPSTTCTGIAVLSFDIEAQMPGSKIKLLDYVAVKPDETKEWAQRHYGDSVLGLRGKWGDVPAPHKEMMRWQNMGGVAGQTVAHAMMVLELAQCDLLIAYEPPYGSHATATGPLNRAIGGILSQVQQWTTRRVRRWEVMPVNTATAKAAARVKTFRPAGSTSASLGEKQQVVEFVRQGLIPGSGLDLQAFDARPQDYKEAVADAAMIGWAGAYKLVKELRDQEWKAKARKRQNEGV